jgi:hypothetical protein
MHVPFPVARRLMIGKISGYRALGPAIIQTDPVKIAAFSAGFGVSPYRAAVA